MKGSRGIIAPQTQNKQFFGAAECGVNDDAKFVKPVVVSCHFMKGGGDGVGMMFWAPAH